MASWTCLPPTVTVLKSVSRFVVTTGPSSAIWNWAWKRTMSAHRVATGTGAVKDCGLDRVARYSRRICRLIHSSAPDAAKAWNAA